MRKIVTISIKITLLICLLTTSCKTISKKHTETAGKIIYKNLIKQSKEIDFANIQGLFRIKGIEELPSVYLKFDSQCYFKEKKVSFKISSFKTPILDIYLNQNTVYLINHTGSNYIKLNIEHIDYSKITGISFSPLDISYFFLGCIPYSENMELMNMEWKKNNLTLDITDNASKYTIDINDKNEISTVKIINQYFDIIILESVKYKTDSNNNKTPSMLIFTDKDNTAQISFIIHKIQSSIDAADVYNIDFLGDYEEITNIEDMQIKVK